MFSREKKIPAPAPRRGRNLATLRRSTRLFRPRTQKKSFRSSFFREFRSCSTWLPDAMNASHPRKESVQKCYYNKTGNFSMCEIATNQPEMPQKQHNNSNNNNNSSNNNSNSYGYYNNYQYCCHCTYLSATTTSAMATVKQQLTLLPLTYQQQQQLWLL